MINRLFLFNPECELAIANESRYYMPPANIVRMADELAFLPAYMTANSDGVLVNRYTGVEFRSKMKEILGIECEEVLRSGLEDVKADRIEPWGWSPKTCHAFSAFGEGRKWEPQMKELYSRKKARQCLELLMSGLAFVEKDILPVVCESMEEIDMNIKNGRYIVKAPWSSSGKGLLKVENRLLVKEKEWLTGILRKQRYVMVERRLNKVYDFAMEFYAGGNSQVDFTGWSEFYTGENGEYRGNYLGAQEKIEEKLTGYLGGEVITLMKKQVVETLSALLAKDYKGYFGVDMMVYLDHEGNFRLQPCVEINLRYNMGIVAWFLSARYVAKGSAGVFSVNFFPVAGEALADSLKKQELYPPVYKNNRIESGYLNLTPIGPDTCFVAELICSYL